MNKALDEGPQIVTRRGKEVVVVVSGDADAVYLSVITVGELKKGVAKLQASQRKAALEDWLKNELVMRFQDHLLSIDINVMLAWGSLITNLEAIEKPLPAIDSLLAATAAQSEYTLVTRNIKDFEDTGILLFNPWETQNR